MNPIQKMMLNKAAEKFKKEGINRTVVNWFLLPEDENFFHNLQDDEIIIKENTYKFLKEFYNNNKK